MSTPRVWHWVRIPDGSRLQITVSGTTAKELVLAFVDWLDSENGGKRVPVDTAKGRPFTLDLVAPLSYSVDVLLTYRTAATAVVDAEVLTPDGTRHGDPYHIDVKAKKGSNEFISFFLFTLQS